MKQKILFLVSTVIEKNDGYKTRIEFEMDILNKDFEFYMCVPELISKKINFKHPVNFITYSHSENGVINKYINFLSLRKTVKKILEKDSKIIVYCEALGVALKVSDLFSKYPNKVVFDCHGTEPDEFLLNHPGIKGAIYSKFLRWKEKQVVNSVDLLVTVTENQYELWKIEKPHVVLPSIPAEHFFSVKDMRFEMRTELSIPEQSVVYVYSGQNEKWQMCEETIDYYKKIETMNPNSFLLVLTHEVNYFEELVNRYKVANFKVLSVDFQNMPKYLDVCDFGFCLRRNHIINRVASPTKVLEYISRNVKPILTEYIGDFSNELYKYGMAEIVDIQNPNTKLDMKLKGEGVAYLNEMREEKCKYYVEKLRTCVRQYN